MIPFSDWQKIELKIGKIISAERVESSDKLLKLVVDTGDEKRQLIAGIGKNYEPEALTGKEIVVVANLEPRSLMGLESQGMLLAADSGDGPVLLVPEREVLPGAKVK